MAAPLFHQVEPRVYEHGLFTVRVSEFTLSVHRGDEEIISKLAGGPFVALSDNAGHLAGGFTALLYAWGRNDA